MQKQSYKGTLCAKSTIARFFLVKKKSKDCLIELLSREDHRAFFWSHRIRTQEEDEEEEEEEEGRQKGRGEIRKRWRVRKMTHSQVPG